MFSLASTSVQQIADSAVSDQPNASLCQQATSKLPVFEVTTQACGCCGLQSSTLCVTLSNGHKQNLLKGHKCYLSLTVQLLLYRAFAKADVQEEGTKYQSESIILCCWSVSH